MGGELLTLYGMYKSGDAVPIHTTTVRYYLGCSSQLSDCACQYTTAYTNGRLSPAFSYKNTRRMSREIIQKLSRRKDALL